MKDFLGWYQATGVAAIFAVIVSLYRIKLEKNEKIDAGDLAFNVEILRTVQQQVSSLTTENQQLRQHLLQREDAHRVEMDALRNTHRIETDELRVRIKVLENRILELS